MHVHTFHSEALSMIEISLRNLVSTSSLTPFCWLICPQSAPSRQLFLRYRRKSPFQTRVTFKMYVHASLSRSLGINDDEWSMAHAFLYAESNAPSSHRRLLHPLAPSIANNVTCSSMPWSTSPRAALLSLFNRCPCAPTHGPTPPFDKSHTLSRTSKPRSASRKEDAMLRSLTQPPLMR
jgi:hypothetical protein